MITSENLVCKVNLRFFFLKILNPLENTREFCKFFKNTSGGCFCNYFNLLTFHQPQHLCDVIMSMTIYGVRAGNYIFKVNNRNTRTRCEICSKLTIKIPKRRHWRRSGIFIVNFERISHLVLMFLLLTLTRRTGVEYVFNCLL